MVGQVDRPENVGRHANGVRGPRLAGGAPTIENALAEEAMRGARFDRSLHDLQRTLRGLTSLQEMENARVAAVLTRNVEMLQWIFQCGGAVLTDSRQDALAAIHREIDRIQGLFPPLSDDQRLSIVDPRHILRSLNDTLAELERPASY
jgi:hypothetical protein